MYLFIDYYYYAKLKKKPDYDFEYLLLSLLYGIFPGMTCQNHSYTIPIKTIMNQDLFFF